MVTLPLFLLFFLAVDEQSQVILVDQDTRKARVRTFYCRFWQVSSPQSRAYAQRGARALLGWQRRSRIVLQGSCLSSPLPNCLCVSIMMMAMAYCYLALPSHFVSTSQLSSPFPFPYTLMLTRTSPKNQKPQSYNWLKAERNRIWT